jgi:hypothetical protein
VLTHPDFGIPDEDASIMNVDVTFYTVDAVVDIIAVLFRMYLIVGGLYFYATRV